ncbi:hypothetical protein QMK17_21260 [Rhodococcus sp. G-MC3]|uniref:hypothetical protein n=1 Tax=Rhodococcus sp. G-MC3 TaxID=3046209 RepID=UPI0024B9EF41|nr:hypothetical protein [Rhodococcus sp. G-MC3]MDJ0395850.1 hypothetical protein [Rhodococcus sp. G-MC3]
MTEWPQRTCPVAVPIDRWGHMPFPADAMSAAAIADIVEAHRTRLPPRRSPLGKGYETALIPCTTPHRYVESVLCFGLVDDISQGTSDAFGFESIIFGARGQGVTGARFVCV